MASFSVCVMSGRMRRKIASTWSLTSLRRTAATVSTGAIRMKTKNSTEFVCAENSSADAQVASIRPAATVQTRIGAWK